MTMQRQFKTAGALLLSVAVLGFVTLFAWVAHGLPASQPASLPAVVISAGLWPWLTTNAGWLIPVIVWFLSSLCTGLSDYPKAGGVVKVLRLLMAGVSVVQFRNAPGSLKLPAMPPSAPPPQV